MEGARTPLTFIVRATQSEAGELLGTVERVRTGEKYQFRGVEGLGRIIAEATRVETESAPEAHGGGGGDAPVASRGPEEEDRDCWST